MTGLRMRKQDQHSARIYDYADRFRKVSTEILEKRLQSGFIYKEAAIAIRIVLAENERAPEHDA